MSAALTTNLIKRAELLAKARTFFSKRNIVEVDTPLLSQAASIDAHIDPMPALFDKKQTLYLITSPEYAMKRLLCNGMSDIYQLGKVFRDGEVGSQHQPEFTLCEWYRLGFSFDQMIDETIDFVELFVGNQPRDRLTYREAFLKFAKLDYLTASLKELENCLLNRDIEPMIDQEPRGDLLNQILALLIEPNLGQNSITALTHYPAGQAALARRTKIGDEEVGMRFELYYQGIELANGYHELADAKEQRERFICENALRKKLSKNEFPLDEEFLSALEKSLPDCCGVAVGFDRLVMLNLGASHINEVMMVSIRSH